MLSIRLKLILLNSDELTEDVDDFFSFDWENDFKIERQLKLKNGTVKHFMVCPWKNSHINHRLIYFQVYKEVNHAYSENTDQLDQIAFCIYVHPAVHITNILPVDVECSIDVSHLVNIYSFIYSDRFLPD